MKKRQYIETCWEEIEKPKQHNKKQRKISIKKQDNDQATPLEITLAIIGIVLCLLIVAIGLR